MRGQRLVPIQTLAVQMWAFCASTSRREHGSQSALWIVTSLVPLLRSRETPALRLIVVLLVRDVRRPVCRMGRPPQIRIREGNCGLLALIGP